MTNAISNQDIEISDYLNVEYKEYANYSISRSLPGIDGLTVVRRKVLWTMFKKAINTYDKRKKLSWISNMTSASTSYAHAESSMEDSINKMVNSFTGSNNYAFLSPDGQAGNILDPAPGSARYVKAYLNDNFSKFFDKTDLELCEEQEVDGELIEPVFLRPKLPLLLLNGAAGTAFAYKTNIYAYNIEDIVRVMRAYISTGETLEDDLVPHYIGYKGKITKNPTTKQINIRGVFEKVDDNRYIIDIKEIPFQWTQEKYKQQILNKLKLKRSIKDYDDDSSTSEWNIRVYCNKEFYEKDKFLILKELGLNKNDTETLIVNTPNKLHVKYDSIVDIITDFCDYRVKWTSDMRERDILNLQTKISLKSELLRFILFWNENSDLHKLSKTQLTMTLVENEFKRHHIESFLKIPVVSLTKTKFVELEKDVKRLNRELSKLEKTSVAQILDNTLNEFIANDNDSSTNVELDSLL